MPLHWHPACVSSAMHRIADLAASAHHRRPQPAERSHDRLPQGLRKFLQRRSSVAGAIPSTQAALLIGACGSLPPRPPPPTPDGVKLEQQVVVRDRGGVVSAGAESKVLAAVKAEGQPDLAERHLKALAAAASADLYLGNAARLLLDGPATFAAMTKAIERARSRVLLESYIVENSTMANELAALLTRKAAQGVQVALLYDGLGSLGTDAAYFDRLAKAGVSVCKFNPVNPLERPGYWDINHRDHRKVLVVDQEVAFTGGINISRVYSSGSLGRQRDESDALHGGWRDTQIELRGPVVQAFARSFARTWADQGCKSALAEPPAPAVATPGQRVVQVLESDPRDRYNRIYTALLAAIEASQRSVWLTMAYFAP